jgi:hypothetical protein
MRCLVLTALNRLGFYTEAQVAWHIEMTHAEYRAVLARSLELQRRIYCTQIASDILHR